jgi:hypothetical protein
MSTLKVNAIQNTSGVEQYLCKAWVNFNGTGTVAIRADGNVSSITDNGTGHYTVNFTTAMPDTNYSIVASAGEINFGGVLYIRDDGYSISSNTFQIATNNAPAFADAPFVNVAVFR